MTTITLSAGAIFFLGFTLGIIAGIVSLAVLAATLTHKKK